MVSTTLPTSWSSSNDRPNESFGAVADAAAPGPSSNPRPGIINASAQANPNCASCISHDMQRNHVNGDCMRDRPLPFNDLTGAYKWADATQRYIQGLEQTKDELVAQIAAIPKPSVTPTPQNSPRLAPFPDFGENPKMFDGLSSLDPPEDPPAQEATPPGVEPPLPAADYGPLGDFAMAHNFQNGLDDSLEPDEHMIDLSVLATVSQYDRTLPAEHSILNPTPPLSASGMMPPAAQLPGIRRDSEETIMEPFLKVLCSVYPVIIASEFKAYYGTLWRPWSPDQDRRPCALADAVLALGAQHSVGRVAGEDQRAVLVTSSYNVVRPPNAQDMARIAASYHTRALVLVQADLASPSVRTAQTYVLLSIYLTHASLFNLARRTICTTIAVMRSLCAGTPPASSNTSESVVEDLLARMWATLWLLDARVAQSIDCAPQLTENDGRRLLRASSVSLNLGADAGLYAPRRDNSACASTVEHQLVRLMLSSRSIQDMFRSKSDALLQAHRCTHMFQNTHVLETLARFLHYRVQLDMDVWERELPSQLRIVRDCVSPRPLFSAMTGDLTIDPHTWAGIAAVESSSSEDPSDEVDDGSDEETSADRLIYQRVHLEIAMHSQLMILRRPFIRFTAPEGDTIPTLEGMFATQLADKMASLAVEHAASLSYVLMQSQRVTDYFKGWPHLLQYQWDAFIVILGFLLGDNWCENGFRRYAQAALLTALSCLEMMSETSPVALTMYNKAITLVDVVSDIREEMLDSIESREGSPDSDDMDPLMDEYSQEAFHASEASNLAFASQSTTSSTRTAMSTPFSTPMSSPSQPLFFATSQQPPTIPAPVAPPMLHSMTFGNGQLPINLEQQNTLESVSLPHRSAYKSQGSSGSGGRGIANRQHSPPTKQRKVVYGPDLPPQLAEARTRAALEQLSFGDIKGPQSLSAGGGRLPSAPHAPAPGRVAKSPPRRRKADRERYHRM